MIKDVDLISNRSKVWIRKPSVRVLDERIKGENLTGPLELTCGGCSINRPSDQIRERLRTEVRPNAPTNQFSLARLLQCNQIGQIFVQCNGGLFWMIDAEVVGQFRRCSLADKARCSSFGPSS